jgi:hypothetical protein
MDAQTQEQDRTFLNLVDFKWLMAGVGWWVDLSRLPRDLAYADECARRGLSSDSHLVRQRAVELMPLLVRLGAYGRAALPSVPAGLAA